MKHLFLIFLIFPFFGLTQNELKESEILSDKGWELVKANSDTYDKVGEEKVKEALVYFDKALSLDKKNYSAVLGKAGAYDYLKDYRKAHKYYKAAIKIDPSETRAYLNRAITNLHMGDTVACFEDYRTAKIIEPDNYDIDVGLGTAFMNQKAYAKAIYYYSEAINGGVRTTEVFHNRAMAYKDFGYEQLAFDDMERAIGIDSTVNYTLVLRSSILMDAGNYKDAIKDLKKALKIDSTGFKTRLWLAYCFKETGQPEMAEVEFKRLSLSHPLEAVPFFNLGLLYKRKDRVKAVEYFNRSISLNKNDPKPYYEIGLIYYYQNKLNEAEKQFEKALQADSLYYHAYNDRGNIYLKKKEYAKALKDYEKSVRINPKYAMAIGNIGLTLSYLNKKNEAYFAYKKAMLVDSTYAFSYYNLGNMFMDLTESDSAILYYTKAIKFKADFVDAYHNLGRVYEFLKHDKEKALENYNKVISIDSLNYPVINSRGYLHVRRGYFELAEMDFLRCIRIAPDNYGYPYNNLANCYLKMNRVSEACKYWGLAIEHGYKYEPKWKQNGIDDPAELIKKHCQ